MKSSEKHHPLVTIALPTYNSSRTLEKALDTILAQSWPNIEVIICDDVSSDNSAEICREYAARHDNIHFEVNERNLGAWNNLRKHVSLATGEYFAWLCPDDYWHPEFISELVEPLESDPDSSASICATQFFYSDFKPLDVRTKERDWPQNNSTAFTVNMCLTKRGSAGRIPKNIFFMIIHGLVRTHIMKDSLAFLPQVISSERQVITQWALAGGFIYVDKLLYFREEAYLFLAGLSEESFEQQLNEQQKADFRARLENDRRFKKQKSSMFPSAYQTLKACLRSNEITWLRKLQAIHLITSALFYRVATKMLALLRIRPDTSRKVVLETQVFSRKKV